jgi:hypothetical protein
MVIVAVLWTGNVEKGIRQPPPNWDMVHAVLGRGQSFESFGFIQGIRRAGHALDHNRGNPRVADAVDVNALSIVGVKPVVIAGISALMLVVALLSA